jgi:8-oxo-dGTP diphosphatase
MYTKPDLRFLYPRVGVAVVVVREGKVLLGQRKGAHGPGQWALPGGKLETDESWVACARRELLEETGLHARIASEPVGVSNDIWSGQRHYVTLYMVGRSQKGVARVMEADKCTAWDWFLPNALPRPLFLPLRNFLRKDHLLGNVLRQARQLG